VLDSNLVITKTGRKLILFILSRIWREFITSRSPVWLVTPYVIVFLH